MKGLPPDIDLTFLNGRKILQLCVGLHDLILNFDESVAISIESALGIGSKGEREQPINFPADMDKLTGLLQVTVTSSQRDDNGGILIFFKNNFFLHIYNDSKQYESFVIKYKETTIVA